MTLGFQVRRKIVLVDEASNDPYALKIALIYRGDFEFI